MARIDYYSCDPFRAWNRLETRPRKADFEGALSASVHDPLWFLTRQWQFGEFQGEDTGSAIFAKTLMSISKLTKFKDANGNVQKYTDEIPLEVKVESTLLKPNTGNKIDAAFMFIKCLDTQAKTFGVTPYSSLDKKAILNEFYPLEATPQVTKSDLNNEIISGANKLANEEERNLLTRLKTRYFDGFRVYEEAKTNKSKLTQELINGNSSHTTFVNEAIDTYLAWFEKTFYTGNSNSDNSWVPEKLEYSFDCAFPGKANSREILSASEYTNGILDWYSFDVNKETNKPIKGNTTAEERQEKDTKLISVIPIEAAFAGAPNSRWWQFEDGKIDLGNLHAETADITKIIVQEYALLYSNDYLMFPYRVPIGSICDIQGIVVTDVFGEQSLVKAAIQGMNDNWSGWGMFNMSTLSDEKDKSLPTDTRLFVAPTLPRSMESEPIESIRLFRDEMTNMVWAQEIHLPNEIGGNLEASKLVRKYKEILQNLESVQAPIHTPNENAMFTYLLGNTVPENWIPFVPVHQPGSNRSIRLQRASMPRLFNNEYSKVRPRSQVLRVGIDEDNGQHTPYFINEEEIPRSGVEIIGTFQAGRWYNGAYISWYGLKKHAGRGEGSSGLVYDRLSTIKKNDS